MTIDELVGARRLERVPADHAAATRRPTSARRHLQSATILARDDPDAAYALLYDAARKAVAAHVQAHGLRARTTSFDTRQVEHDLRHAEAIVAEIGLGIDAG